MVSSIVVVNLDLEEMTRVGRNSTGARFLRFKCHSIYDKFYLLKRAKDLQNKPEYKEVYINPDLTKIQREATRHYEKNLKL